MLTSWLFPLLLCLLVASPAAAESLTAQQVLAACDQVRNPDQPFRFTETLIEYRGNTPTQKLQLAIYAKEDPASGHYNSLVHFLEPLHDRDKIMMKKGNDLWFFDPVSQASVPISPQQRLLGQAANGDVLSVNMAREYTAAFSGEETIHDVEKKNRDCQTLKLVANNGSVTYHKIAIWIEKQTFQPVKAKFFSESGQLLKTAYYRNLQQQMGKLRPMETIIVDGLDKALITKMTNGDYVAAEIPEHWFQKEFLPRFKGLR